MLENEFYISLLITARMRGELDPGAEAALNAWISEHPENRRTVNELEQDYLLAQKIHQFESADKTSIWLKTVTKLNAHGFSDGISTLKPRITIWYRTAMFIAAMIGVIVFGVYLFKPQDRVADRYDDLTAHDIAPGRHGATLKLANGRQIRLSDAANGQLAKEAGVSITKSETGELVYEIVNGSENQNKTHTLSTANGEVYNVKLPDGSHVWLNSATSLTYSANLIKNGRRTVTLEGEGYFEVAKDKAHPFVVESKGQKIEVLGTHFNLNAYHDEGKVVTTLIEGAVKVSNNRIQRVLKPGQQSSVSGNEINIETVDVENSLDWKKGEFSFGKSDFRTTMRDIARWYDIEIIYDPSTPQDIESGGWISKDTQLSTVLRLIEKSGQVHFRLVGKKLYVSK